MYKMLQIHRTATQRYHIYNVMKNGRRLCTNPQQPQTSSGPPNPNPSIPPHLPLPAPKRNVLGTIAKVLGLAIAVGGGVAAYAWSDKDFRNKIEMNVPYSKNILKYIPEKNTVTLTSSMSSLPIDADTKKEPLWKKRLPFVSVPDQWQAYKEGKVAQLPGQDIPVAVVSETIVTPDVTTLPPDVPKEPVYKKDNTELKKDAEEIRRKDEAKKLDSNAENAVYKKDDTQLKKDAEEIRRKEEEKQLDSDAENMALELILVELVQEATEATVSARSIYKNALEKIAEHQQLFKKAMNESEADDKEGQWQLVNNAQEHKSKAINEAEKAKQIASEQLEKLGRAVKEGQDNPFTTKNQVIIAAAELMNKNSYDLSTDEALVGKALAEHKVLIDYKDLVEKGRKQFQQELASILPDVKLGEKRGSKLTFDELNSLIGHAHCRIEQLLKQLAEQQAMEQQRLDRFLQQQQELDEKSKEETVTRELDKQRNQFKIEMQKLQAEMYVQFESDLRLQLARQAAAHNDHLADVLRVQRQESEYKFAQELRERLVKERELYHGEVSGWIARLKGIEAAVEGRAALEKQARKSQELWLACQSLLDVIEVGDDKGIEWEEKLVPLHKEFAAAKEAGDANQFVDVLVESVPNDALKRGVWTEKSLRQRFWAVRRACRRVAMINENGASLPKYFLSYLQSLFVFDFVTPKSSEKFVDIERMDTFSLLSHASYCLQNGDLEQAVRYVNHLEGMPRKVADDWLKEARLLLETKQIAMALNSFASASGLGSLY